MDSKRERAEKRKAVMRFRVGERVRIRKWEDMEREYGLDKDGDIATLYSFTRVMRKYCGKTVTIKSVNDIDITTTDDIGCFFYTVEAIERIGGKQAKPVSKYDIAIIQAEAAAKLAQEQPKEARANAKKYVGKLGERDILYFDGKFKIGCQEFNTKEMKVAWEAVGKRMRWKR